MYRFYKVHVTTKQVPLFLFFLNIQSDVYDHITVYSVHKQNTQHGEVVSCCLQCERDYLFNPVAEACAENYKVQ